METKVFDFTKNTQNCEAEIEYCANVIKNGGLVVFPTETVYGLGADATNEKAVSGIYEAKGRPSDNPLIIHIASPEDAEEYAYTNSTYYKLAESFMPGPLTVVLKSKSTIPSKTRGGLDTVAVRCPVNQIARNLIKAAGRPIAAPSANLSGTPSPTNAKHVIDDMLGRVDVIIDGGNCDVGLESTIVKIEDDFSLTLLRPGKITVEDLSSVVENVGIADAVVSELKQNEVALSPGMKYRHYAPKAEFNLLDGDAEDIVKYIIVNAIGKVAIIAYNEDIDYISGQIPNAKIYSLGSKHDKSEQAQLLFFTLREIDKENFDIIFAPLPEKDGIGLALYNRMIRAAAHSIINLRR